VDHVLRAKRAQQSDRRVRAIIVYPMNALANSQLGELEKFLRNGYPKDREPVTFARYTGQEKQERRDEIRANPPDILLTNYVMVELMLTRPSDRRSLIRMAEGLEFLVFDELHTYRGRQGADVAMLIRRVKDACAAPDVRCIGTSATNEELWQSAAEPLRQAPPQARERLCRIVLNEMRRSLAIEAECFDELEFDRIKRRSQSSLTEEWALGDDDKPAVATVFAGSGRPGGARDG
jgi:Lhr-like helicase